MERFVVIPPETRRETSALALPVMQPINRPERAAIAYSLTSWLSRQVGVGAIEPYVLRDAALTQSMAGSDLDHVMVAASALMERPIGELVVLERCGNVVLTAFEPHRIPVDPVMPIYLGGWDDTTAYALQHYVQYVLTYVPPVGDLNRKKVSSPWWREARRRCDDVLDAISKSPQLQHMSVEELVYFVNKVQVPLAFPAGYTRGDAASVVVLPNVGPFG